MISAAISRRPFLQHIASFPQRLGPVRFQHHKPFDADFDPDELAEARKWHESFSQDSMPKGRTSFSRSSGAGGQHVNKTETKATTIWPVGEILRDLPQLMRPGLRASRYYTKGNDSITMQAQTERSKSLNADENQQKLFKELQRIYRERVPGESNPGKRKKYEAAEKSFHEARIKSKKQQGSKKASRKGRGVDY